MSQKQVGIPELAAPRPDTLLTLILRGRRLVRAAVVLSGVALLAGLGAYLGGLVPEALLGGAWFGAGLALGVGGCATLLVRRLDQALKQHAELVSRLDSAQERLVHAHKLEAVGLLSGGVAHDFNNTLTVILSYGELLKSRLKDSPLSEFAELIVHAAEQGGELTKQLLTFSRRQIVKPRVVDVQPVLKACERAIARLVPKAVQVKRPEHAGPLLLNIDPTQLQQAVLNLALNARDAMPEGGELRLEADLVSVEEGTNGLEPGSYVVVRVRDTGVGMSEELLARIFEPFFTTKEPGLGTGLGLSNVRETVEAAGGTLTVESRPGHGSTFSLYFPRVEVETRVSGIEARKPGREHAQVTLLVVDDEPQIREVIQTMLAESGYDAITADSAHSALAIARERRIDLLCSDLVMPDMPGGKLVDEVRKVYPGLPVVVCSAYGTDDALNKRVARGDVAFLAKPFTRAELLEAVEKALGRRSSVPEINAELS